MLNSKWLKNLWTNFLKIYNSTIDFASIFIKVMQLSMFSIQIPRKKNLYTKFWISRNFLVIFKFFLQIKVVPIIYEWGKVEKVRSNLSKITVNFWTVCVIIPKGTKKINIDIECFLTLNISNFVEKQ